MLWSAILVYTGIIYATLPLVSAIRKTLVERYGEGIYNYIYFGFGLCAAGFLVYTFVKIERRQRLRVLAALLTLAGIYGYYLGTIRYAVEKVHFLEYGFLGALLVAALWRTAGNGCAFLFALNAVYWIGLGDEAIQWVLPNRVGELRDAIINLVSGALGIAGVWCVALAPHPLRPATRRQLRAAIVCLAISAAATFAFVVRVHGFGQVHENAAVGRMYSSLSSESLRHINDNRDVLPRIRRTYDDEAVRHLFQREFYLINKIRTKEGGFSWDYPKSLFENRVLETWYRRFLAEHDSGRVGPLIAGIDREVAEKTFDNSVVWSDTTVRWIERAAGVSSRFHSSRVKETIITSFSFKDFTFYTVLVLGTLLWCWFSLGRGGGRHAP